MRAWRKVMAAYRRVHDSRHLQADCKELGSTPEPYARQTSMGYLFYVLYSVCVYRYLLVSVCALVLQLSRRQAQEPAQLDVADLDHVPVGRLRRHRAQHVLRSSHRRLLRHHGTPTPSRDVAYASLDAQQDESYTGRGRRDVTSAAGRLCRPSRGVHGNGEDWDPMGPMGMGVRSAMGWEWDGNVN